MTEYSKVFLDTTPLIFFLDADENYNGPHVKTSNEELMVNNRS